MVAYAVTPAGDTIPLIRINHWDFHWQYFHTPATMIHVPAGSTIYVEGTYDNTRNNPHNPFRPPREVRERAGGMRDTDEMFQCILMYVAYEPGDESIRLDTVRLR